LTLFLIEKKANLNVKNNLAEVPLFLASSSGNVNIVTSLIRAGCDCNAVTENGITPLLAAIDGNHIKVVTALLTNHKDEISHTANLADVNKGTTNGIMQSPLLFSVVKGKNEIAKILLDSGAYCNIIIATNPNNVNDGETLLEFAKRKRDYDMIQVLTNYTQCDPQIIRK
jgi:ankyrin repeat protein